MGPLCSGAEAQRHVQCWQGSGLCEAGEGWVMISDHRQALGFGRVMGQVMV